MKHRSAALRFTAAVEGNEKFVGNGRICRYGAAEEQGKPPGVLEPLREENGFRDIQDFLVGERGTPNG